MRSAVDPQRPVGRAAAGAEERQTAAREWSAPKRQIGLGARRQRARCITPRRQSGRVRLLYMIWGESEQGSCVLRRAGKELLGPAAIQEGARDQSCEERKGVCVFVCEKERQAAGC